MALTSARRDRRPTQTDAGRIWDPRSGTRQTVAVRTVLGVVLLSVAVLGLGGPIFYAVGTLMGAGMHVNGGLTRLAIEVAVGSYALYWACRLRMKMPRATLAR